MKININNFSLLKFSNILILILIIFVQSCGIPTITLKDANKELPNSFQGSEDTLNTAKLPVEEFFKDQELKNLIDSAIVNNKELNILLQKISVSNNEILNRRGEYLPFIKAGTNAEVDKVGNYTRTGAVEENLTIKDGAKFPSPFTNFQFGLYSTWELDIWKKLRNAEKVAVMEYLASLEGKKFLVTNLVSEIAISYYELIALDNQLITVEKNIEIQQSVLVIINLLQQSARSTSLAVKRFEAEILKNKGEIFTIKQEIVEVENKINFLIGRLPQTIKRNSIGFTELQTNLMQSGVPSQLLQNRPDIKKAELELMASQLNIEVAKANFYPSLSLKAGLGYQSFNPRFLLNTPQSMLYSIGGDLLSPLVNRNAIEAEYLNASAKQIQSAYEYEQKILIAYNEVMNELSRINNLQTNFQLKNEEVNKLIESTEISKQMFQSARADYMEVLLTQRDALDSKMKLIEIKKKQFLAMINLYRKLGGGWY